MTNKTEVSGITPEELLTRVKSILEKTIKETVQPKPEQFVGVPEVAKFCNESPRWVYLKCKEVMEKYRVESSSSTINYTIDEKGNIIS
jgi:hypothetical protein